MTELVIVTIPVKTVSEANSSDHWRVKYRRAQSQKELVRAMFQITETYGNITLPCTITLVRCGKRTMDSDNLASSLKYIRDAVAEMIIVDRRNLKPGQADGDPRITWLYDQRVGKGYSVEVKIDQS